MHGGQQIGIVGQRAKEGRVAGRSDGDAARDEPGRGDNQPCARDLGEAAVAELAEPIGQRHQGNGRVARHAAFVPDNLGLDLRCRKPELQGDEALPRAGLEVLEAVLIARVVRDDELEAWRRIQDLARLVERQDPSVVGQRMDDHDRVLPGFDDLIEVADGPVPRCQRERAVEPDGVAPSNEIPSRQIARRQIVVAGDGHERPAQPPRHVLDEPCLAAAGRPLQHHRQPAGVARFEDGYLSAGRQVERRLGSRVAEAIVPLRAERIAKRLGSPVHHVTVAHAVVGAVCAAASASSR